MYAISLVEQLTGIKAHTLRIWEKRYNSLIPHRTPTNIRYYDDDQLKKLLNISTLLQHGYKISNVVQLEDEKISELITGLHEHQDKDKQAELYVTELVDHMLSFNERSFDKVLSSAMVKYGVAEAISKVVYPFLRKTGLLWSTSNAAPSQEHFASNIVKRKLLTAIDGIPYATKPKKRFLLFLPPDEWHEIGLLLADYLVRQGGGETVYLGQNVPHESLEMAVERTLPDYVLTFLVLTGNISPLIKELSEIAARHKVTLLVCSGTMPASLPKNVRMLASPEDMSLYI